MLPKNLGDSNKTLTAQPWFMGLVFCLYSNPIIMKKHLFFFLFILISSCKVNQLTGKKNIKCFFKQTAFPYGIFPIRKFLKEHPVVANSNESNEIKWIGARIANAAQTYFEFKGTPNHLADYQWEYNLVKNAQRNAWCMPGGKIIF